jgi:hypothetical protein
MKNSNKCLDIISYIFVLLIILFFSSIYCIYLYNRDKQTDNYMNSYQFQVDRQNYVNSLSKEK